jgi:alcohol dehydrogenase|tara:strand:- start:28 stop:255 length:228 start_codon:yes stop_codon:yes gene_type:complete
LELKSFNSFLDWILDLREKIKIPHKLSECAKITNKDIEKLSSMALNDPCTPENPKKTSLDDMKLIYQHSLEGKLF